MRLLLVALLTLATPALAQPKTAPATPVVVMAVEEDQFFDSVEALGTLRANETVTLTTTVTQTITAVNFEDGQRVEKGAVLVEMTDSEEKAQLEQAKATMTEAQQQLERLRPLVKKGAAAQSLLDQRQREYKTAEARFREIESLLQNYMIKAPFSGIVGLRNISVGTLMQPGLPITTLDDDSVMKLDFNVPSLFLSALKIGLPVVARAREFEGQEFHGTITSLDSQIDPVTRSLTVRALIPNEEHLLKPGLLMSVMLLSNERQALVVPEESLIQEGTSHYVMVAANEPPVAEKRKVTIGARRPGEVEILEGLKAGDLVITHGSMTARPNQPVSVIARQTLGEDLQTILKNAGQP